MPYERALQAEQNGANFSFVFGQNLKVLIGENRMPSEREPQEEQNGTKLKSMVQSMVFGQNFNGMSFSSVAPTTEEI